MKSETAQKSKARAEVIRNRVIAAGIIIVVFVLPIGFFVGAPVALHAYDSAHRTSIECKVTSARPVVTSSRSAKGIGATEHQIEIHSSCGLLLYADGVTASNEASIAAKLIPGFYRVKLGAGSWSLRGPLDALGFSPVVSDLRRVNQSPSEGRRTGRPQLDCGTPKVVSE